MFTRASLVSILDLAPIDACIQLSSQLPRMTAQVKRIVVLASSLSLSFVGAAC